jgi:hypothetical protein
MRRPGIVSLMLCLTLLSALEPSLAAETRTQRGSKAGSEVAGKLNPFPAPSITSLTAVTILPWFTFGAVMCGAGGLIGAAAFKKTELTNEEAFSVVAACFLPGIGTLLVRAAFARHPEWNLWHCEPLTRDARDLMIIASIEPKCWMEKPK